MSISSKDVANLRNITGLGMMDCKKALEETNGDFDKAIDYLRKKGISKGEQRSGRAASQGVIEPYIHPGSQLGVLLELNCETDFVSRSDEFKQLAHNLAMQIAASSPTAVRREEVPQHVIDKELEIYREQMANEKKPPEIKEKIAIGKLEKYFQTTCLLEQQYVKDPNVKVSELVLEVAGKLKENIVVKRFTRFQVGE